MIALEFEELGGNTNTTNEYFLCGGFDFGAFAFLRFSRLPLAKDPKSPKLQSPGGLFLSLWNFALLPLSWVLAHSPRPAMVA